MPPPKRSPSTWSGFTVIVTKSTVPVGTGDEVEEIIRKTNPGAKFAVVQPGIPARRRRIGDFKRPDRVVVGTDNDEWARARDARTLSPLFLNETPICSPSGARRS
jgi:UDPglucose 6-dehydrogenase